MKWEIWFESDLLSVLWALLWGDDIKANIRFWYTDVGLAHNIWMSVIMMIILEIKLIDLLSHWKDIQNPEHGYQLFPHPKCSLNTYVYLKLITKASSFLCLKFLTNDLPSNIKLRMEWKFVYKLCRLSGWWHRVIIFALFDGWWSLCKMAWSWND